MPELPEVETVRRGLAPAMVGAVFSKVDLRRPDLRFPLPERFVQRLKGAAVESLARRGKYMVAVLSSGDALIMHLGMTGRFTVCALDAATNETHRPTEFFQASSPNPLHDHVTFWMDGAAGRYRIDYNDPRRFGFMDLVATADLERCAHFIDMGPEPMGADFTAASFRRALAGRTAPIKAALLDQSVVAGLGNIYVCEALYEAGIAPRRKAGRIGPGRTARLHAAIRRILADAIAAGGSSLQDFAGSDGALGYFQHRFRVYDREGEACPACDRRIRRIVQSGRSTFYCGTCQR